MTPEKQSIVNRIWATIKKRDRIRQLMLDNNDNFNPNAAVLMKELATFCYAGRIPPMANKITGAIDPIAMAIAQGRREVYLRIVELLRFSDEKALKMIEQINQQEE